MTSLVTTITPFARQLAAAVRSFRSHCGGMAAVEFAMILPVMIGLLIGVVELSYALTVTARVQQVASSMADLVARAENQISQSNITDIMNAGSFLLAPYSQQPLTITVLQVNSAPNNANNTKQAWSCVYSSNGATLSCACSNTSYTLPQNLVGTNDSIIVGKAAYDYKPLVFNYFLKNALSGQSDGTGGYNFLEIAYRKPRGSAGMLLQSNGTPCPAPPFP
jgi:Flp pilus assembly protein TadG